MADITITETTKRKAKGFRAIVGVDAGQSLGQVLAAYNPTNTALGLTVPTGKKLMVRIDVQSVVVDALTGNSFKQT